MICARDLPGTGDSPDWRGLCLAQEAGPVCTALPVWNWGEVYIRLARSILRGGWDELSAAGAVNYWWGFASGAVDVQLAPSVPDGPRELLRVLREALGHGELTPFHRRITDQEGTLRNDGEQWFSPETILRMDWLCSNVTGKIPDYERSRWCACSASTVMRSSRRKGGRCCEAASACGQGEPLSLGFLQARLSAGV